MQPFLAGSATLAVAVVLAIVACQGAGVSSAVTHSEAIPGNTIDFPAINS
jgi:hypothetical protein